MHNMKCRDRPLRASYFDLFQYSGDHVVYLKQIYLQFEEEGQGPVSLSNITQQLLYFRGFCL